MTNKKLILSVLFAALLPAWSAERVRGRENFDAGWRFLKADPAGAEQPGFDDGSWRRLNLPHDWSIEGPYSPANASGTGYLPGGIAWYRRFRSLPPSAAAEPPSSSTASTATVTCGSTAGIWAIVLTGIRRSSTISHRS
jgi:hypothetical protein